MSILDEYVNAAPSRQTAVDMFAGEWSSKFPEGCGAVATPGLAPLFDDPRLEMGNRMYGGFNNRSILELGPLEGGHTYMLQQFGAKEIDSVEANSRAFMKCLITKEIFDLNRANFMLGNFMQYLSTSQKEYDWVVASGVLYHMREPLKLLRLISEHSRRIFLWTHYYDKEIIDQSEAMRDKFGETKTVERQGKSFELIKYHYQGALQWQGFCGGPAADATWLTRDSLLRFIRLMGFKQMEILEETPLHQNGPAILLCAQKP